MARSSTSFQPGRSGNPGGRPRGYSEFREKCRDATDDVLKRLRQIVDDPKASNSEAIAAGKALLEWGHGKPETYSHVNADVHDTREHSVTELRPDVNEAFRKWKEEQAAKDKGSDEKPDRANGATVDIETVRGNET